MGSELEYDANGIPGSDALCLCLTGYQGVARLEIMMMVEMIGARFTKPLIASKVTHLICYKFEGDKYELAKKVGIKIVNHLWLEDCLKSWTLVPESDYSKSGWELEAEVEDSEEGFEGNVRNRFNFRKTSENIFATQLCGSESLTTSHLVRTTGEAASPGNMPLKFNADGPVRTPVVQTTKHEAMDDVDRHHQIVCMQDLQCVYNEMAAECSLGVCKVELPAVNLQLQGECIVSNGILMDEKARAEDPSRLSHQKATSGKFGPEYRVLLVGRHGTERRLHEPCLGVADLCYNSLIQTCDNATKPGRDDPLDSLTVSHCLPSPVAAEKKGKIERKKVTEGLAEERIITTTDKLGSQSNEAKRRKSDSRLNGIQGRPLNTDYRNSKQKLLDVSHASYSSLDGFTKPPKQGVSDSENASSNTANVQGPNHSEKSRQIDWVVLQTNSLLTAKLENSAENMLHSNPWVASSPSPVMVTTEVGIDDGHKPALAYNQPADIVQQMQSCKLRRSAVIASKSIRNSAMYANWTSKIGVQKCNAGKVSTKGNSIKAYWQTLNEIIGSAGQSGHQSTLAVKIGDVKLIQEDPRNTGADPTTSRGWDGVIRKDPKSKMRSEDYSKHFFGGDLDEDGKPFDISSHKRNAMAGLSQGYETCNFVSTVLDRISLEFLAGDPDLISVEGSAKHSSNGLDATDSNQTMKIQSIPFQCSEKRTELGHVPEYYQHEIGDDQKAGALPDSGGRPMKVTVVSKKGKQQNPMSKPRDIRSNSGSKTKVYVEPALGEDQVHHVNQVAVPAKRCCGNNLGDSQVTDTGVQTAVMDTVPQNVRDGNKITAKPSMKRMNASSRERCSSQPVKNLNVREKENICNGLCARDVPTVSKTNPNACHVVQMNYTSKTGCNDKWFVLGGSLHRGPIVPAIKLLGANICKDKHRWSNQATHVLLSSPLPRTETFLAGASAGRWILKPEYVEASLQAGKLVDEEPYEWYGTDTNVKGTISLQAPRKWRIMRETTGCGAFHGLKVLVYGECHVPSLATLKLAIVAGGGTVVATSPPYERALSDGVDFAILNPEIPRTDKWVAQILKLEVACVTSQYFVDFICFPSSPQTKNVLFETNFAVEKAHTSLKSNIELVAALKSGPTTPIVNAEEPSSIQVKTNAPKELVESRASLSDSSVDDIFCSICGGADDEVVMLLCGNDEGEGCGKGTHTYCCEPPLPKVPDDDWFCVNCKT